jgi:deazaflavin-dependent oxidoreductase (nitroreductase family)
MTEAYKDFDVHAFQRQVIAEFREKKGKLGGMFEGWALVVLTTVGAKSDLRRTSLLGYLEIDGKPVVVASAMGAPRNPGWYHNIRKNPMVTVETGTETYAAIAAIPPGDERDKLFDKVIGEAPGFADYQAKTTRVIPVVVLHRVEPAPGAERVKGMGDWLVEVHAWLRQELNGLRRQVDRILDGSADSVTIERAPSNLGQELRAHCLNFCAALKRHHTGEDLATFPMLARQFPALAPALTKLGEEHAVVARLQQEIQQLVDGYVAGESDPAELRDDLERLASELEAHFEYEEQTVVMALNATAPAPASG